MKTLEQHNADARKRHMEYEKKMRPHPNGIACPKCGQELWDSDPMVCYASNPPMAEVHCRNCGFVGFRS